jgi:hypothetical protein
MGRGDELSEKTPLSYYVHRTAARVAKLIRNLSSLQQIKAA